MEVFVPLAVGATIAMPVLFIMMAKRHDAGNKPVRLDFNAYKMRRT